MRLITKAGLVALAAMVAALTVGAVSASALTITPVNTAVAGTSTDSKFAAAPGDITCDDADANGVTSSPASDTLPLSTVTFAGKCVGPLGSAIAVTTTANGATPWSLSAVSKAGSVTSGVIIIPTGGNATIVVTPPIFSDCTITVGAQQVTATFDESSDAITVNDTSVAYTTSGGVCGSNGNATFTATYAVTPTTLTVT